MTDLQIFKNPEFGEIRTIEKDGEPWFVAADVCRALEISNPTEGANTFLSLEFVRIPGIFCCIILLLSNLLCKLAFDIWSNVAFDIWSSADSLHHGLFWARKETKGCPERGRRRLLRLTPPGGGQLDFVRFCSRRGLHGSMDKLLQTG